jgi:YebC/PmpR family DNA-binding regulatory protein
MGGHNKWSQIKRQKGANDAAKSNLWGKLSRRITVESKKAGGDANAANVRAVVEQARKENMPKDAIERALAKGTSADAGSLEAVTYETYGPGGCAIVISALTDNRNRTAQEIKHLLSKHGLSLASPGSALWAFDVTQEGYAAKTTTELSPANEISLIAVMEALDGHDDVQETYTNAA